MPKDDNSKKISTKENSPKIAGQGARPVDPISAYWKRYFEFNDPTKVDYDPLIEKHPLPPIENLVLQGGGSKVTGLTGVLKYIRENNAKFKSVKRIGGSSGGAMAGLFFALDYKSEEMDKSLDFAKFKDIGKDNWWDPLRVFQTINASLRLVGITSEEQKYGICKGDACYNWASELIAKKLGNPNATFKDLHDKVLSDPAFKDLYVTGTCIDDAIPLKYFNYETTPDMSIALAVRISMSFPGGFNAVEMDGKRYIDGGAIDNNPMRMFDNKKYMSNAYGEKFGLNDTGANPCTLGFSPFAMSNNANTSFSSVVSNYIGSLYPVKILGALLKDNKKKQDQYYATTVLYDTAGIGTLQENISDVQHKKAVDSGYESTKKHMGLYRDPNNCYDFKAYKNLEEKYNNLKVSEIKIIQKHLQNFINNPKDISAASLKKIKDEFEYASKIVGASVTLDKDLSAPQEIQENVSLKVKPNTESEKVTKLIQNYGNTIQHQHKTNDLCNNVYNELQKQGDFNNANVLSKELKALPKLETHLPTLELEQKLSESQAQTSLKKEKLYDALCKLDKYHQDYIDKYNVASLRVLNFLTILLPNSILPNKVALMRKTISLRDEIHAIRNDLRSIEKWNQLDVDKVFAEHKLISKILSETYGIVINKIPDNDEQSTNRINANDFKKISLETSANMNAPEKNVKEITNDLPKPPQNENIKTKVDINDNDETSPQKIKTKKTLILPPRPKKPTEITSEEKKSTNVPISNKEMDNMENKVEPKAKDPVNPNAILQSYKSKLNAINKQLSYNEVQTKNPVEKTSQQVPRFQLKSDKNVTALSKQLEQQIKLKAPTNKETTKGHNKGPNKK